jgi:ferredoxin
MVFYFSGTGNSRFVAERIAKAIGHEAADITAYTKQNKALSFIDRGLYVFVCPSYMSATARSMTDFIESAEFPSEAKAYFVVTCASSMGISPKVSMELCARKGLKYMGAAQVVMPQNYIALFKTKDKIENGRIINEALPMIDKIAETIKNGEKLESRRIGSFEYSVTKWVRDLYYKDFMKTKKFMVTDKCISCKKCVKVCPLSNITMKDNRPAWGNNCTHCMACINQCPKDAIEYGKGSVGKPRYKGPEANI